MTTCSPEIHDAFEKVVTGNQSEEKRKTWFDFKDGYRKDQEIGQEQILFSLSNDYGANAVHRAHFLDELVKLVPEGVTHFKKHLDTIDTSQDSGKLTLKFHDGTTAEADAVVGCDGIKSRVRAWMMGDDHPSTPPVYTHKYAYRGLIPMDKAIEALGKDNAQNSKMHLGQDGHVLTFSVNHGETMNVVAFWTNPDDWPSHEKLTLPSTKEHVKKDFTDFNKTVHKIIDLLEPDLDCWAIFDTGDHPMPYYNKGKVCVIGDAGHATSPHHGAGAGICIEDCAVMAELLADPLVAKEGDRGLAAAFHAYNQSRLERTQWLVQSSRRSGDLYDWRAEGVGKDLEKIEEECRASNEKIWNGQIDEMVKEAKEILAAALQG